MSLMRFAFRSETAPSMYGVLLASLASVGLVVARIAWTGDFSGYAFLVWNLFLAWLPLVFALLACRSFAEKGRFDTTFAGWTAAWLLFFPNAPYILTDLVHLTKDFRYHFWIDLSLILCFGLTGFVLGFFSLFLMQGIITRVCGKIMGWVFVGVVAGLSGFGIYLGRFLRFNSWDLVTKPFSLWRGIGKWLADPFAHSTSYAFPVLFAMFVFVSYTLLYTLTYLPRNNEMREGAVKSSTL